MVQPGVVELWSWPQSPSGSDSLSADEHARAARFVRTADAEAWIAARAGLRRILGFYLGRAPDQIRFEYNDFGRPTVADAPDLAFSLSHSGGFAALAVGTGITLGIDIEAPRDIEDAVARRFFSPSEQSELAALPAPSWLTGFYNCWTRKEALVKAIGTGLTLPLTDFDVTLTPGSEAKVTRLAGGDPADWALHEVAPRAGLIGCLAIQSYGTSIRLLPREGWAI